MAAAILPSQGSIRHRHSCRTGDNPSSWGDNRRKRRPAGSRTGEGRSRSQSLVVESPVAKNNLVMGQVKILKRGETLSLFQKKELSDDRDNSNRPMRRMCSEDFNLVFGTTDRLGPEPETVQKQIGDCKRLEVVVGVYAVSGCSVSPPPSSLPIPGFLGKNKRLV